ncbi:MAG: hypothetical protein LBU11_08185 [Zoogloeaceae bacterium]|nr:hypothetical protein [Zoogloeaceae bacterium]
MPDYELLRWDESNFDPNSHPFTAAAYKTGYYAFVSDYVRMLALYQQGGVYLDVDVEVYDSFDGLLNADLFIGLEDQKRFSTAVIGATAGHWLAKSMLLYYDGAEFNESKLKSMVNVNEISRLLMARGFSGLGDNERLQNEYVLEIGMLASASPPPPPRAGKSVRPLARHLYTGSWKRNVGKGIASRTWRRIRKMPEQIMAYGVLQMYRVKKLLSGI